MFDFIVIGGGIAGASIAAELSPEHSVLILEMEDQPGYHASGRSAALYSEIYGNATIRGLTRASRDFYHAPPAGFCDVPLLRPREMMFIARPDQMERLATFAAEPDIRAGMAPIDAARAIALCPVLRPDYVAGAIHGAAVCADIETATLHQGYLRQFRRNGGTLRTGCRVEHLDRLSGGWRIKAGEDSFEGAVLIDAAGAWADEIAVLAGRPTLGLRPLRRTAILVDPPACDGFENWPAVGDIEEAFYFKPDAGLLMLSPGDETPDVAGDAQPDELDVAIAIDRVTAAADIPVRSIRHRWAGLRTFAPDRNPVIGFDEGDDRFFWLAGQGGYGFQTAPALARAAAALVRGGPIPDDILAEGIIATDLAPGRFAASLHGKHEPSRHQDTAQDHGLDA